MPSLFVLLAVAWSFLYWLLGGVLFSIIALLKVGRIRRTRFGCLFSLAAVGAGILAAWSGLRLSAPAIASCPSSGGEPINQWMELFTCGIVGIVGSFLGGFVLLLFVGFVLLSISKTTAKRWIENDGAKELHHHDSHSQNSHGGNHH